MGSKGDAKMKDLKLEEGEMICDKCEGTGTAKGEEWISCSKCLGSGKVDWIENIMGKKIPGNIFIDSSSLDNFTALNIEASSLTINGYTLDVYVKNVLSKQIAEEIDRKVLEILTGKQKENL